MADVIIAFTEEHVQRLTGLTKAQLRYWDRTGFFKPAYADDDRKAAFSRIYSFRDVVGLRTLGILRNIHKVPLQNLRLAAKRLSHLKDALWTKTTLFVLARRVVFRPEGTEEMQDAATGQLVMGIPLRTVIADVQREAEQLRERSPKKIGTIERHRRVAQNAWVVGGTRIPVRAIRNFHEAGYSVQAIMKEYPDLTERDIKAALAHEESKPAAA
jgi:uncharacterized protein (DUF433 family)